MKKKIVLLRAIICAGKFLGHHWAAGWQCRAEASLKKKAFVNFLPAFPFFFNVSNLAVCFFAEYFY